ncbi:hypothetical protein [Collimonas humicola]|uniref:hypothetical protein n=1 Tax=Collimonas humicola TaxID=2825886 RepID=UPI001B8B4813|nr:hypothetical protein [Collimonas humicola]
MSAQTLGGEIKYYLFCKRPEALGGMQNLVQRNQLRIADHASREQGVHDQKCGNQRQFHDIPLFVSGAGDSSEEPVLA